MCCRNDCDTPPEFYPVLLGGPGVRLIVGCELCAECTLRAERDTDVLDDPGPLRRMTGVDAFVVDFIRITSPEGVSFREALASGEPMKSD